MTQEGHEHVNDLVNESFTVLRLSDEAASALSTALDEAGKFFARGPDAERRHSSPDENFGYRAMGREYSITPDRPDVNDCFTLWSDRRELIPHAGEIAPFVDTLLVFHKHLLRLTRTLLAEIAREVGSGVAAAPPFLAASHIQVNDYHQASDKRELLQERHEDGYIITLLHARQPGLEVIAGHGAAPVSLASNEVAILPGSTLTALSGGLIDPLEHQVRNLGLKGRRSLMYFVNPELTAPILPWRGDTTRDLRAFIQERPNAFGLPDVPTL